MDILNRIKATEGEIKSQTDGLLKLEAERQKIAIHEFLLLKGNQRDQIKARRTLNALEQQLTYLRIRHNQRLEFVRRNSEEAFALGQELDTTSEWETAQKVRRLQSIQRDWDARVPKSTRYSRTPASEPGTAKAKPSKSDH